MTSAAEQVRTTAHRAKLAMDERADERIDPYDYGAEQTIIAQCIIDPERIASVKAALTVDDFEGRLNSRLFAILAGFHDEGRRPSIEAIVSIIGTDEEVTPYVRIREYLKDLIGTRVHQLTLSITDAIEVVQDASRRRQIGAVAAELSAGAYSGTRSVADLCADGVAQLDNVLSSMRAKVRQQYDVGAAGEAALELVRTGSKLDYPTTGLIDLDKKLGGFPRGELTVIAGRPGAGKSAVATSLLLKTAKTGECVQFFSLEMHKKQLGARMLTDLAYVSQDPIEYQSILQGRDLGVGHLSRLEAAAQQLAEMPIKIEEQRGLTVAEISARARKHAADLQRNGLELSLLVVDHLHIVKASNRYAGNRNRELAEISSGFAELAKELNCAVVALCQLSRAVEGRENKRPSMPDLRESGAIEEDASVIIFLFRAAYYLEKLRCDDAEEEAKRIAALEQVRHKIEFGVDKNRNGCVGVVDAFVDIGANAIRNASFRR